MRHLTSWEEFDEQEWEQAVIARTDSMAGDAAENSGPQRIRPRARGVESEAGKIDVNSDLSACIGSSDPDL
jgi:hypothetical protein